MNSPNVVVVGSVNVDMVVKGDRLPAPGETVIGGHFSQAHGGKGANQAVALARLGAEVALVARVGRDAMGDESLVHFDEEGLDVSLVMRDEHRPSGVALILIDAKGQNQISVASEANAALSPEDVDRAADEIRRAKMLVVQLEVPQPTVLRAMQIAHEAKVPILLDPAPVPSTPLDEQLFKLATYVKPNETEAQQLTGIDVFNEASAREAAKALRQRGAQNVIVTLGCQGAFYDNGAEAKFVASHCVNAVDTTAAGDAFCAALAMSLAEGQTLEQAVAYGNLVGALTVTRLGAQTSLPTAEDVNRFAASLPHPQ